MQDFLENIQEIIPKITKRKAYLIVCAMKWRGENYWSFGIWKRDGPKYGISERQMSYFIALLVDYWYIKPVAKVRWSRGYLCTIYKASSIMKDIMASVRQGLNWVCKRVANLTDRIKQWNESNNAYDYLVNEWKVKKWKLILQDGDYIIDKKWRRLNIIYNTVNKSKISLFDYLRGTKSVYEMSLILKIIG